MKSTFGVILKNAPLDMQCSSEAQRVAGWGGQGAVHAQLHKPAVSVVEAAQAALISLPQDCASEADRLLVLCEKLVEVRRHHSAEETVPLKGGRPT